MTARERWLRANWTILVVLLGVFLVALFLRGYFAWGLAAPDRLLSGGSDSYYYERVINYCTETGRQLTFDDRLNYPIGQVNPRPPLFSWSVCVAGKALSSFAGSLWQAITVAFLGSTAVWGALTIFPMYFLGKEAFGKRAGILAAFFLAILPAHLARSPATNGDHDAMVLFFVVTTFFFFLKSLKALPDKRWVEDWTFWKKAGRTSIRTGFRSFFAGNRTALLYALMAGWGIAAIALIWQGWAYVPIILLVYFLFQMLVLRFRSRDPMGVFIVFAVALGLPLLVAFPWYWQMSQFKVWFDVPLYLYFAALALGLVFTVSRDYPWALVVPLVIGVSGVSLVIASFIYPGLVDAFVSGAGYFVRTKAYETIAEAQPPGLSQIILSFGVATYFFSLFGLLWMAYGITKHPSPDYLFVVVWAIAAIFMAQAAARFIFNASPAFAVTSAWVAVLLLEWMKLGDMVKTFRSLGGSRLVAIRRSVKLSHVLGALLIVFILLLPNVWFAVDAAIPYERKSEFDREIYGAFPDFLRPAEYEQTIGTSGYFYLGAFGYSLPLEREYWPAAWRWFRSQDTDVNPVERRPAFLSWWDYGFEAVDVGAHPTVADNFLDGYQLAGNFITAQSEEEAVALLNVRLLEGDFRAHQKAFGPEVKALLEARGLSWTLLQDAFRRPEAYVATVEGDVSKYGLHESVQPQNAVLIFSQQYLANKLGLDGLASLNHDLREVTGDSIRYFAVDTRLFPLDGSNTGIFYAPVKLSDHRILELKDGRSVPRDFFDIMAETQRGTVNVADLKDTDQVSSLTLKYKDAFYNSMFYRAYVGFSPKVVGQSCDDCIPGLTSATNQQIANIMPMQGWNLSHFRLVYRTAYYNPYGADEVANHTDAWKAVSHEEARDLQQKINSGNATGVVDYSPVTAIRRGIVVLKYYDGAFVNGTVTLAGEPWPGVRITITDDYGTPHDMAFTDAEGKYSVLSPFGKPKLLASIGAHDPRTMVGATHLGSAELNVSDAASLREEVDDNGDGVLDWLITHDFAFDAESFEGDVYVDSEGLNDVPMAGAEVTLDEPVFGITRTARAADDGHVRIGGLYPGTYNVSVSWRSRRLELANVTIAEDQGPQDIAVPSATLAGYVWNAQEQVVPGALVTISDLENGTSFDVMADASGRYHAYGLLPGGYEVSASGEELCSILERVDLASKQKEASRNLTVYPAADVTVQISLGGLRRGFVTVTFRLRDASPLVRSVTTDAEGVASVALPEGTWDVHARHYAGTTLWAHIGTLTLYAGDRVTYPAILERGAAFGGRLFDVTNTSDQLRFREILLRSSDGEFVARTDAVGRFLVHLPLGTWTLQVAGLGYVYVADYVVSQDLNVEIGIGHGTTVSGAVTRALAGGPPGQNLLKVRGALVRFSDAARSFEAITDADGFYEIVLPSDGAFAATVTRLGFVPLEQAARSAADWRGNADFAIHAANVTVSGTLLLVGSPFTDPALPASFRGLGLGAENAPAILDGLGGYTASLAPGDYILDVERDVSGDGKVLLQTKDDVTFSIDPGARPVVRDVDLALRYQVDGKVQRDGQPTETSVEFEGPDVVDTDTLTGGTFSIHLAAGEYTVRAEEMEGPFVYAALQALTVTDPTDVVVSLMKATNVTGTVTYSGQTLAAVPVTFTREGGGSASAQTDDSGRYRLYLLGGTYDAAVDHPTTITRDGTTWFVRYTFTGSHAVAQNATISLFPISPQESLDNATVDGTVRYLDAPAAADLSFVVRGKTGLNATARAGSNGHFTVGVQPGSYDVYAYASLARAAYLGPFELANVAPTTLDLDLAAAFKVSGVTTLPNNARVGANVTFKGETSSLAVRSDAQLGYEVFLPAFAYSIEASAVGRERGVEVAYTAVDALDLSDPAVVNLKLAKVSRWQLEATWDDAQRTTIAPGGSADYTIVLKNTGNEDDTYVLSGTVEGFTFEYSSTRVAVPFGSTGNERSVQVTVEAASDAKVDHSAIILSARSEGNAQTTQNVVLQLDILRYRGLEAKVSSDAPVWDGRMLNYTIDVKNRGNGPETFRLTLPNRGELLASGWQVDLVGKDGVATTSIDVAVGSNATEQPVLRLVRLGGASGTLVRVRVTNTADASFDTLVTVNVQMPSLSVEGSIRAIGLGLSAQEPGWDVASIALLVSVVAIVAAAAYLAILRRRSR